MMSRMLMPLLELRVLGRLGSLLGVGEFESLWTTGLWRREDICTDS